MQIVTTITLGPDEFAADLTGNATQLADKILKGVGGDPAKDSAIVLINDSGKAGAQVYAPVPEPGTTVDLLGSGVTHPPSGVTPGEPPPPPPE